jgi:hypothetical protein
MIQGSATLVIINLDFYFVVMMKFNQKNELNTIHIIVTKRKKSSEKFILVL